MEISNSNQKQVDSLVHEFFVDRGDVLDMCEMIERMMILYVADEVFFRQPHLHRLNEAQMIVDLRHFLQEVEGLMH